MDGIGYAGLTGRREMGSQPADLTFWLLIH
jgi:hypothetical protein